MRPTAIEEWAEQHGVLHTMFALKALTVIHS